MTDTDKNRWRTLWVLPPILVGVAVVMFMAGGKQPPAKSQAGEPSRAVRVIQVPMVDLVPYAEGYGSAQPAQVWTAVAQVTGRVIEKHPKLRDGEILAAGTPLFRIDPVDYELSLAQAEAEFSELAVQEENTRASLAIEQRNVAIAGRELSRLKKLAEKGSVSQSNVDEAERGLLGSRATVQNLENTLALLPTQRRLLEARRSQAERDLANTSVTAPFNLRVASLAMEADQYVSKGQNLFEGDSVDQVEVVAQVPMSSLRNLFIGRPDHAPNLHQFSTDLAEFTGFKPLLKMDLGRQTATWDARFVRFSDNVDSATRTIGVVVAVDDPLSQVRPGQRPPLSKGMFVQVLLSGHTQPGRVIVPRGAVRDNRVYLVDADSRLRIREVKILYSLGDISVVEQGVEAGQQLVVSDLVPAVDGMLLEPVPDPQAQAELGQADGVAQ